MVTSTFSLFILCRHHQGIKPLHSRTMRSIALRRNTILSQDMSPSSSTTKSTIQTSGMIFVNPVTQIRRPRPRAMRKHYLSSLLFILEREEPANLRQVYRGDPYTFVSQNGNQIATWKTKDSGFSLKNKQSKFSLKSELRSMSLDRSIIKWNS